jgi:3D (Asp-Asp-Asp) domain-containing protein
MTNAMDPTGHGPELGAGAAMPAVSAVGAVAAIVRVVTAGARCVVELIDRIVHGIRYVAPLVLGLGACESTNDGRAVAPVVETAPAPEPVVETGPRALGKFTITFYYVVGEDEVAARSVAAAAAKAANDNRTAAGDGSDAGGDGGGGTDGSGGGGTDGSSSGGEAELAAIAPDLVTLYGDDCEPIADVSREFASQLTLQGTGKLHDGRIINIWGACGCPRSPCFKVTRTPWGTSGTGRPLQPFRTIAVDPKVVKLGSLLYMPLLEGRTMPGRPPWGGFTHDGCVVADDTGGNIRGNRIDLFVGRRAYYLGMSGSGGRHAWARNVPVFDGSKICERSGRRVGRKAAGAI